MGMATIIHRIGRRGESCGDEMEASSVVEPMLSVTECASDGIVDPPQKIGTSWFERRQRQRVRSVSPSSPSSSSARQNIFSPRDVKITQIKKYIHSKDSRCVAFCGLLVFAGLWRAGCFLIVLFFGPRGSIKGGHFGNFIDQFARDYVRYHTILKWRDEIRRELHIPMVRTEQDGMLLEPRFRPLDVIIKTRPNVVIVEMLLREKRRLQHVQDMIQSTSNAITPCSENANTAVSIPKTVLQLESNQGQMNHLLPYWITRSELLQLDYGFVYNSDVSTLSQSHHNQHCRDMISGVESYAMSIDLDLFCLAFRFGGIQLSSSASSQYRPLIESILVLLKAASSQDGQLIESNISEEGSCNTKVGYAILTNTPTPEAELRKTSSVASYVSTIFSALSPNHPGALCLPPLNAGMGISPYTEANLELSFQSVFTNRLATTISHARSNLADKSDVVWGIVDFNCDFQANGLKCCNEATVSVLDSLNDSTFGSYATLRASDGNRKSDQKNLLVFTVSDVGDNTPPSTPSMTSVSVSIKEQFTHSKAITVQKQSIQERLKKCGPEWWCNRCLQTPLYGSFSKCISVCSKCVSDIICDGSNTKETKQVSINVHVEGLHFPANQHGLQPTQQRIPRIIHQTWYEDITIERYPQLFRLQNTWRASGWEYRFYNDDTARRYIENNYPPRFVAVFDSITPGAYKADFFRYLVLYKEGGIYVDVDVMLNANLDIFVTPDLAFFAPIDAVGSYVDDHFCVWNGLIGSMPAHLILANVIEWVVNLVSSRGDMYDMERSICQLYGGPDNVKNWKIRAEPSLLLTGPCSLGLAVNNALGNDPLAKFDTGLIKRSGYNQKHTNSVIDDLVGDVMILVADKQDLGAFRFSDPERNMVVATTDMEGLFKSAMKYETKSTEGKKLGTGSKVKPHYSMSTRGEQLWGTHDVYADNLVSDEHVSLVLNMVN